MPKSGQPQGGWPVDGKATSQAESRTYSGSTCLAACSKVLDQQLSSRPPFDTTGLNFIVKKLLLSQRLGKRPKPLLRSTASRQSNAMITAIASSVAFRPALLTSLQ